MLKTKIESEKEEKTKQLSEKIKLSKNNETDKTKLGKLKLLSSEHGIKRSRNEIKKLDTLKSYIKKKCKLVTFLLAIYMIIFGAITSTPSMINHFRAASQNRAEQDRFIT